MLLRAIENQLKINLFQQVISSEADIAMNAYLNNYYVVLRLKISNRIVQSNKTAALPVPNS